MDLPENLDLARQAIAHLFNQDLQIRCVVIKEMQNIENSQQTNEESMLNTVLNLGGKLVNSDTVSDQTD